MEPPEIPTTDPPPGRPAGGGHELRLAAAGRSLARAVTRVCAAPPLKGRPAHLARYVEQGFCRVRWVAAVAIPLWLLTAALQAHFALPQYASAAQAIGLQSRGGAMLLVLLPLAIGVGGAVWLLLTPRASITVPAARRIAMLWAVAALTCEGLQLGFTHGAPEQMASFVFANLLVFALVPLRPSQCVGLMVSTTALPLLVALATGLPTSEGAEFGARLTLPLSAAIVGTVIQFWNLRNFRLRTLAELRLQRRTKEVERHKQEVEYQRQLAESDRVEAEHQRARAMHLLASALTAPVARAYERDGYVRPFTQTAVVIFCDAVNFSDTCRQLQPERVVSEARRMWVAFDRVCLDLGIEPLRAEGDARMAVAGLDFDGSGVHTHQAAIAATLAMLRFRKVLPSPETSNAGEASVLWPVRIGIDIGPVTAGVIDTNPGKHAAEPNEWNKYGRLWFDVWGDTVNMAARLAQAAEPNQIRVRERLLWETGGLFEHGPVHGDEVKGHVLPDCAEVLAVGPSFRDGTGEPNASFWETLRSTSYRPVRPSLRGTDPSG